MKQRKINEVFMSVLCNTIVMQIVMHFKETDFAQDQSAFSRNSNFYANMFKCYTVQSDVWVGAE